MSDGLTVPFALAAGLSGAIAATNIIVTAGLAEVAAGAIAMGLGGFLAARTDIEHYRARSATRDAIVVPRIDLVLTISAARLTRNSAALTAASYWMTKNQNLPRPSNK